MAHETVSPQEVLSTLERYFQAAWEVTRELHRRIDEYEDDFYLRNTGDDLSPENPVVLTDLADTVVLARNILMNAGFRIHVDRPGDVLEDRLKAALVSDFLHKLLDNIHARAGYNVVNKFVDSMLKFGVGAMYVWYDSTVDALPLPSDFISNPPIRVTHVDPRRVYLMPGGPVGRFSYVVYRSEETLEYALRMALAFDDGDPEGPAVTAIKKEYGPLTDDRLDRDRYPLTDYWGWHLVDGRWVVVNAVSYGRVILRPFTVMEGYVHLPWVIAPAQDTEAENLADRFIPITFHGRVPVRRAERIQARMDHILDKIASMPFVLRLSPESPNPPEISGGEDHIVTLEPGQDFQSPNYGTLPRDLWPRLQAEQVRIEKALLPSALFGISGQASGYSFEQLQEGGRMRLQEVRLNLEFAMEQLFYVILGLTAHNHADEVVYRAEKSERATLYGRDLEGWVVDVTWDASLPGDELRKVALAQQTVGGKLLSRETALRRYLGVNAAEEIERIVAEEALVSNPQISQAYALRVLRDRGALPDPSDIAEAVLQEARVRRGQVLGTAVAAGVPPEEAMRIADEYVQNFMQGALAALSGVPGAEGIGASVTEPSPSPAQAQRPPPQVPQRSEPQPEVREGGVPPGHPGDPAAALAELARRLRAVANVERT